MFQCSCFPWLFSRLLLWLALSTVFSSQSAAGFILPFNFGGSGQIDARFTANPLLCSFSDEATGFYASWHSNCSGLVNFVLNVRNFPRPELPPGIGLYRETVFGHFWTGIGFHLISTEMALVESPAPMLVSVTPARIELGRPPVRELGVGGGILINSRGSFIGSTLEATFSVDESLLTGCKELLFYSAPTPVGAPYGGVPYSKAVCDLARTCTRFPTCGDFGTPMLGAGIAPMDLLDGQMPIGKKPMHAQLNATTNDSDVVTRLLLSSMPAAREESQWVVNFTVSAAARNITADETLATTINATTDNAPIDASKKALSTAAKGKTKRRKRQISQFNFGSLKDTAYEGQARLFQREPPVGAVNTRFVALDEWSRRQPQSAAMQQPMGMEAGGQNQTPMYLPWRTMIGHDGGRAQTAAADQKLPWANNVAADVFYDPAKCDGGVDPDWCAEYVRHFLAGGNTFNSRTTVADQASAACPALLDALWKSDHHCCNIIKRMGC